MPSLEENRKALKRLNVPWGEAEVVEGAARATYLVVPTFGKAYRFADGVYSGHLSLDEGRRLRENAAGAGWVLGELDGAGVRYADSPGEGDTTVIDLTDEPVRIVLRADGRLVSIRYHAH